MPRNPDRILEIRQLTGMSQQELAAMLHTSRSNIAMHESEGRSLPNHASLYYAYLLIEMGKPGNEPAGISTADNDNSLAKWKKELQYMAVQKRREAEKLQLKINAYNKKQAARLGRQKLLHCAEKVQAQLLAQSKGSGWQPITERQVKWLEMEKSFGSYLNPTGQEQIAHLRNQFRHGMLLKEVEEAERMLGELG